MELKSLGYIGINSTQLDDWSTLVTRVLGMQQVDRGGQNRAYRMDDRKQRLMIDGSSDDVLAFLGWEVGSQVELDAVATRLEAHGTRVTLGTRAGADARFVEGLVSFSDPAGNRIELFHGPSVATDPFIPGRPISGFRTGPLGMGHAVLNVEHAAPLVDFYRDLLGFRVSDYSVSPYKLYFFHLNERHHSFAIVESAKRSMHHFMVELGNLDDVGQGYDIAKQEDGRIAYTLGRHTNDHMTSFYSHTPSGFFIEYGWGGRLIDPQTWQPHETFDGPSLWGHERLYLPEDQRGRLRNMRLDAAARGVRAPDPTARDCPWLASVIARQ